MKLFTKVFAVFILFFAIPIGSEPPVLAGGQVPANAQADSIYTIKAGTKILLRNETEVSSKVASVGDTFTARTVKHIASLPVGTIFVGKVVKASEASSGRSGKLEARFDLIRFENGRKLEIDGVLVKPIKAASSQSANILTILGGTAVGAIVGGLSGTQNGALIGAGIGAGAGTGAAFLRKGRNVKLAAGEEFEIELKKDVTLPVTDF